VCSSDLSEHDALHQANHGHWQLAESLKQETAAKEQAWSEERSTLDSRLSTLVAERDALATSNSSLATERNVLLASTFWRITAPIRNACKAGQSIRSIQMSPKAQVFMRQAVLWMNKHPFIHVLVRNSLNFAPKLKARMVHFIVSDVNIKKNVSEFKSKSCVKNNVQPYESSKQGQIVLIQCEDNLKINDLIKIANDI
jgi:hypothetical protein